MVPNVVATIKYETAHNSVIHEQSIYCPEIGEQVNLSKMLCDANNGVVDAQVNLAIFYQNGIMINKDLVESLRWFKKAAENGDAQAQLAVGQYYDMGVGTPVDHSQALKFYIAAAQNGNVSAQYNAAHLLERNSDSWDCSTIFDAIQFYKLAAHNGCALAQFKVYQLSRNGSFKAISMEEGDQHYRMAMSSHASISLRASEGDEDAIQQLLVLNAFIKGEIS